MNSRPTLPRFASGFALALLGLAVACATTPQKPRTAAPAAASNAPPTHTIARGALKAKAQVDATVEAAQMEALKFTPKAWLDLTVLDAVPHGARVKKGDWLVKMDTEKLRDQIEDLEQDKPGAALAFELATAELENLKQTTPLRLDSARRAQRIADEEYSYWLETNRAQREKGAKFNLKNAEERLAYAQEELKQLEKMYKADDLTEDTEEIILRRQKFAVESSEYYLESTRLSTTRDLQVMIPRENETLRTAKRDQDYALTLSEQSLPKTLAKKILDLEKTKRDQRKAEKRLADLKADLDLLSPRASMDGIVYYGACEGGKWPTAAMMTKKLFPGGKLMPTEIFMTLLNPDKLRLKAIIPESELANFKPGLKGTASPVSAPDKKLPARLEDLGQVPLPGGGFEALIYFDVPADVRLMPGMSCKVSLNGSQKSDALLAPKEAVFGDGADKHVFLAKPGAKPEPRAVKTGETDDKQIEILDGLKEGDQILLKKPQ